MDAMTEAEYAERAYIVSRTCFIRLFSKSRVIRYLMGKVS